MDLKYHKDWTVLTCFYFYCNKRELWHDNSIHVEREIKNNSLTARFANSSAQSSPAENAQTLSNEELESYTVI